MKQSESKSNIPWAKPDFWGDEVETVKKALESTWISGGPFLDEIEARFRELLDKKHVLAVSNGTTALHLAYLALDLKPGDEVVVPGFCFLAAANIALHLGAKPVFAEVDPETWCLTADSLEKVLTSKTKAIVPVHTYGNVCDLDPILTLAREKKIAVIEDCAESLFSKYKGRISGSFGDINTFSFQATKTITTGEGGLVVTHDDDLARRMTLYRSHGMDRSKRTYWHELPGHNFRLTNLQAALGVAQLNRSENIIRERQRVYETYRKQLSGIEGISLQKIESTVDPVIWAVALKLDVKIFPQGRDAVMEQMKAAGIETRHGFFASSILEIYGKHSLPVCESISRSVISLPSYPTLTEGEISRVTDTLLGLRK